MEFNFLESLPAIAPEFGLMILAIVVLALDVYLQGERRSNIAYVSFFGMLALAATPIIWNPAPGSEEFWGGMVRHDSLAQIFKVMVLLAGAITSLIAASTKELGQKGEFYLIIIISTLGACLMSASGDLIMVFVALETTSIPLYVLAAFSRKDGRSVESGMKYFLFGSFASAIMLYGFSFLYGFAGTTNLSGIAAYFASGAMADNLVPVVLSIVLVFVGFGFKISAVPFHFWTPDVYEGAPTPVTAFVSVASKAASFALLMRFFVEVFPQGVMIDGQVIEEFWISLMIAASVISMTVGNVLALSQRNIKRMLAYSSIAQAGYTLIGVAALQAATAQSVAAVSYYLLMYTFTNLLAFGIVVLFTESTGSETIADLAGFSRRSPMLALAMTIALLSLAGIPPAAGFIGKFFLFQAAVEANLEWLAIIGVLNAIIALYYYLMVIKIMYVDRSEDEDKPITVGVPARMMVGITLAMTLILGIIPGPFFDWALEGATALFEVAVVALPIF
ncbi:MAG: NADH:ubiquinone oxidoreductase subunit 2 (chain N) [Chloroflexi bacterium AL-W]|nr:NADH:ubiquinone oxidoreductase subunit 2 (chain N) [Chloroflexi bacterium AL-W]